MVVDLQKIFILKRTYNISNVFFYNIVKFLYFVYSGGQLVFSIQQKNRANASYFFFFKKKIFRIDFAIYIILYTSQRYIPTLWFNNIFYMKYKLISDIDTNKHKMREKI